MFSRGIRRACGWLIVAGLSCATVASASYKPGDPDGPDSGKVIIKAVPAGTPISVADKTGLATVGFKRFRASLQVGEELGPIETGIFKQRWGTYKWDEKFSAEVNGQFQIHVNKELAAAGYTVAKKQDSIFETSNPPDENSLEIGVLVRGMKFHMAWMGRTGKGEVFFDVKWAVFDPKTQKVLLELPVEASFQSGSKDMTGDEVLTQGVIAVTRNLLADPKFVAALAHPPEPVAAEAVASVEKAVYSIPGTVPPKGGMAKNSTMLCAAVVTVETSAGTSGSGFYISREGYLITNQHVVGDAGFVKIRTATGREMPGEVLMTDAMRDVALVKTQKTAFDPLALHLADPNAGDEVFAIGSPLGDQFNGTVTHGVVSGFREIAKRRFLQSDVSITHGNSGGPLVDANGAVIGITKGFLAVNGGNMNFFIPIGEALAKLSIEVKAPEPAPASPPAPALKGKSKAL